MQRGPHPGSAVGYVERPRVAAGQSWPLLTGALVPYRVSGVIVPILEEDFVPSSPREVVEQVRRMVAGEGVVFADLFAEGGILEYPFAMPGQPRRLRGREAIRAHFSAAAGSRRLFVMDGVDALVRETDDPEVIVAEIEHHGRSLVTGDAYRFRALGVIRVCDGEIVSYQDYMDPIAAARLLGRTADLAAALTLENSSPDGTASEAR